MTAVHIKKNKKKLGCKYIQREDQVKTQKRSSSASQRVKNSKTQHCWQLDLRLLLSRTIRKLIYSVESTQAVVFCHGKPSKLIQCIFIFYSHSIQFSSVAQLCPTLCDPMSNPWTWYISPSVSVLFDFFHQCFIVFYI